MQNRPSLATALLLIGALIAATSCGLKQTTEAEPESSGALNRIDAPAKLNENAPAPLQPSAPTPADVAAGKASLASATGKSQAKTGVNTRA